MKTVISPAGNPNNAQHGFTFIIVLAALVIVAILAEMAHVSSQYRVKRDTEAELLFRGQAYLRAIKNYYQARPNNPRYPQTLDDLLNDPRFAYRRHIRRLYDDPLSGEKFQLLRGEGDGIIGVAPNSEGIPLKQSDFPAPVQDFEGRTRYSEWRFEYLPSPTASPPPNTLQDG